MSRPHHYVFGHVALRQIFFENPEGLVGALIGRGNDLLLQIWEDVGSMVEESEESAESLMPEGLAGVTCEIGSGILAVIVSLPTPEEMPESHFVALVYRPSRKKALGLLGSEKEIARYITLEYGVDLLENRVNTVLCEWTKDAHLNLGEGPEATLKAFTDRLREMVAEAPV